MNDTIEEKRAHVEGLLDRIHPVLEGENMEVVQNLAILMLSISAVGAEADERRGLVDAIRMNLLGADELH
jgi:hypothetical protein